MTWVSLGRLATFAVLVGALFLLLGCSCEEEKEKPEDLSKPPAPLSERAVPSNILAKVYPQVGAVSARPTALVVAQDPGYCSAVRKAWKHLGHVLCVDQPLDESRKRLKQALGYLKKTHPRHTAQPPVHLFTDSARSEVGWRLMLEEPGFFAHAFLAGLEDKKLNNITLAALHSQGAKTLVLTLKESKRLKLLKNVAARRGLTVHAMGPGPKRLEKALAITKRADSRLVAPPQTKKPN